MITCVVQKGPLSRLKMEVKKGGKKKKNTGPPRRLSFACGREKRSLRPKGFASNGGNVQKEKKYATRESLTRKVVEKRGRCQVSRKNAQEVVPKNWWGKNQSMCEDSEVGEERKPCE